MNIFTEHFKSLTLHEQALFMFIVLHRNHKTGKCNPSLARMADMLRMRKQNVFAARASLKAKGLIAFTESAGGRGAATNYTITEPIQVPPGTCLKKETGSQNERNRFPNEAKQVPPGTPNIEHIEHNADDNDQFNLKLIDQSTQHTIPHGPKKNKRPPRRPPEIVKDLPTSTPWSRSVQISAAGDEAAYRARIEWWWQGARDNEQWRADITPLYGSQDYEAIFQKMRNWLLRQPESKRRTDLNKLFRVFCEPKEWSTDHAAA